MNEPTLFQNLEFGSVRVVMRDGEPWFVAKDVAVALGYPESSLAQISNLINHIPQQWAAHNQIMVRSANGVKQLRDVVVLSEQGLYFFLARSDKPKAIPYQMWVAGEVMPSIRKTGQYGMKQIPQTFAEALRAYADEVEAHEETKKQLAIVQDHDAKAMAVVGKLADALGYGKNMKQVKAIPWFPNYFNIENKDRDPFWGCMGKYMVMLCDRYGYKWDEIPDSKYGKVKTYPVEAFEMLQKELDGGLITPQSKYIGKFLKEDK